MRISERVKWGWLAYLFGVGRSFVILPLIIYAYGANEFTLWVVTNTAIQIVSQASYSMVPALARQKVCHGEVYISLNRIFDDKTIAKISDIGSNVFILLFIFLISLLINYDALTRLGYFGFNFVTVSIIMWLLTIIINVDLEKSRIERDEVKELSKVKSYISVAALFINILIIFTLPFFMLLVTSALFSSIYTFINYRSVKKLNYSFKFLSIEMFMALLFYITVIAESFLFNYLIFIYPVTELSHLSDNDMAVVSFILRVVQLAIPIIFMPITQHFPRLLHNRKTLIRKIHLLYSLSLNYIQILLLITPILFLLIFDLVGIEAAVLIIGVLIFRLIGMLFPFYSFTNVQYGLVISILFYGLIEFNHLVFIVANLILLFVLIIKFRYSNNRFII